MSERRVELEVLRYNPETDGEPHFQRYSVTCREEWVVLDALNHIKETVDPTLSYRWSCHMAVCGSCGMMIDGEPRLACKTFVRDLPDKVRIEPLENFPIERDLVVVLDDVIEKLQRVQPYIIRKDPPPENEEFNQPRASLMKFKQYTMCINCMCCYAACPQYGLNDKFTGPAALALLHRYNADSRDGGQAERAPILGAAEGVWSCTAVAYCSEVCPKGVDPANAVNQNKVNSAKHYFLGWLTAKGG